MDARFHPGQRRGHQRRSARFSLSRHRAALCSSKRPASMCEFVIKRGANASARDLKNGGSPAGWAAYGGHPDLSEYLEARAKAQTESEEP